MSQILKPKSATADGTNGVYQDEERYLTIGKLHPDILQEVGGCTNCFRRKDKEEIR